MTTPNDIGVIGTNDFGVGVEFTLTAASEVDTLFHLTTTGGVRNFVSVLIDHTTGLLKGEVAWLGNGQSYSEYLSVPLANLPFTVGLSHTVALARVNLPDGSTRLELWFDGVVVDTTLTTAVPNLPAFTVVEVGQMTNWYSGSVQHPATGTFGALQVGTAETLFTAPETPATTLSPTPTIISGTSGDDDFTGATGDQRYEGGTGYDEVKYFGPGSRSDAFVFTQQADGSVLASSPAFGEDTLTSIEGIWFDEEAKWYSVPTLLAMAGVVTGTPGDETFVGVAGNTIYQDQGGFDQIDYNGPGSTRDAFVFTARADGGVQVVSTTFGTDTLYGVESVWFDWDGAWYLTTDLLV